MPPTHAHKAMFWAGGATHRLAAAPVASPLATMLSVSAPEHMAVPAALLSLGGEALGSSNLGRQGLCQSPGLTSNCL